MRKRLLLCICVLQCLFSFSAKRALLVGIGNYPPKSGWQNISSANDVTLLKTMLVDYDVQILVDQEATHKNIKKAIVSLSKSLQKGDTILMHFSCHGQQMLPLNDSEEIDKLDEALVPYDAYSTQSRAYDGRNHLRDDEMGKLFQAVRKKVGTHGLVLVTIDACFSDSMNKGIGKTKEKYRGGADIFGSNAISKDSLDAVLVHWRQQEKATVLKKRDLANVLILSACQSFQRNKEVTIGGKGYGSLSYAMYSSYKEYGMSNLYKWLDGIYNEMEEIAFSQTPKIRTTLPYSFPIKEEMTKDVASATNDETEEMPYTTIAVVLSVVGLLILVLIWMKLKNKT